MLRCVNSRSRHMKKPPVLTGGFLLCLSCEHFPQSFEEMTVGHFQHTGDHTAFDAAGNLHAAQRTASRGVDPHAELGILIIHFTAGTFGNHIHHGRIDINLVQYRNDLQIVLDRKIEVRYGLSLNSLGCIHDKECTFTRSDGT